MIASLEPLSSKSIENIFNETKEHVVLINRNMVDEFNMSAVSVLICRDRDITESLITRSTSLKMIYILSVGVDRLSFSILRKTNIKVCHVDGNICSEAIAQYVIASMLAINCNLLTSYKNQCLHHWQKSQIIDTLFHKKVLLTGYGSIGKEIAKYCNIFHMEITCSSQIPKQADGFFSNWIPIEEALNSLDKFDFVINSMPLTHKTFHIFGYKEFCQMKSSAVFINIARGSVVNEQQLLIALKEQQIKYAILDVFEKEPLPQNSELWDLDNVLITPHTSGRIKDFVDNAIPCFIYNYQAYIAKKPLPNEVNLLWGY